MCNCTSTKAWWFCITCKRAVIRVTEKGAQALLNVHKQTCPNAQFRVKQINK